MRSLISLPDNQKSGFTLIEMLVVVSIVAVLAAYFTNFFINRLTYQEVRSVANEMVTLNRALTSYYSEYYRWPGQDDSGPGDPECLSGNVFDGISPSIGLEPEYIAGYDRGLYSFDCEEPMKMVVSREVPNQEFGEILAAYLPSAVLRSDTSSGTSVYQVEYYVLRPRLPMKVNFFSETVNDFGRLRIDKPEGCDDIGGDPAISVNPVTVCSSDSSELGGYLVDISDSFDGDQWVISLFARSDLGAYDRIVSCPFPGSGNVRFQGMVFCERD